MAPINTKAKEGKRYVQISDIKDSSFGHGDEPGIFIDRYLSAGSLCR